MALFSKSFKDFSLTFEKNAVTNDVLSLRNEAAIKESVKNIVQYNFYDCLLYTSDAADEV